MKNKLKVFRAIEEITQEKLAKELFITRQSIVSIEKGKYDPSLKLAFKISRYFNVTIEDIFLFEEE